LYEAKGEYDRALPLYEEALEMKRAALPPGHPSIATSLNNLAGLYKAKGEYDRALPLYEEALEMKRAALPPGHPRHRHLARHNLAGLYKAKGEYDRALPLYEEALEMSGRRCHRATPASPPRSTTWPACTRPRASTTGRCRCTRRRWR
jgi:tetratricopeptide (TPR) repeat protein